MAHVPLATRDDLDGEGRERWDAEIERSGAEPSRMKRALLDNLPSYG